MLSRSLILSLVLGSLPAAAVPRDVIGLAVPTDDADRGVYRAAEAKLRDRASVVNLSVPYRELHEPTGALSQGRLDAAPPVWWPKELAWDWESGAAACKTRAETPYGPENKDARSCGGRLAEALWQRFIEQPVGPQKLTLVVQIVMEPVTPNDPSDDRQRLRLSAYVPGEPKQRTAERREVEYLELQEVASVLALRLATGGGSSEPRAILRALPQPKPKQDEPIPSLAGVPVPRGCKTPFPEALAVSPSDGRLSQILMQHWANTAAGAASRSPAISCELDAENRPEKLIGQTVLLGSATLTCTVPKGTTKVVGKLHKTTQSLLDQAMSQELVKKLVENLCRGS